MGGAREFARFLVELISSRPRADGTGYVHLFIYVCAELKALSAVFLLLLSFVLYVLPGSGR